VDLAGNPGDEEGARRAEDHSVEPLGALDDDAGAIAHQRGAARMFEFINAMDDGEHPSRTRTGGVPCSHFDPTPSRFR